jgi:hypothetical protein
VEILLENTVASLTRKPAQSVINRNPDDLRRFIKLCELGMIYEHFMQANSMINRNATKEVLFGAIVGKSHCRNVRLWRSLEDHEFFVLHPNTEKEHRDNVLPLRKLAHEVFEETNVTATHATRSPSLRPITSEKRERRKCRRSQQTHQRGTGEFAPTCSPIT